MIIQRHCFYKILNVSTTRKIPFTSILLRWRQKYDIANQKSLNNQILLKVIKGFFVMWVIWPFNCLISLFAKTLHLKLCKLLQTVCFKGFDKVYHHFSKLCFVNQSLVLFLNHFESAACFVSNLDQSCQLNSPAHQMTETLFTRKNVHFAINAIVLGRASAFLCMAIYF